MWQFLKSLNTDLLYDPAVSILGAYPREVKTYPHKNLHTNIHSTIVHKSPEVERTQVLIADEPIKKCGEVGPMFLLVSHLWSQPTADGKYLGKKSKKRTFLVSQWLRLCAPDGGGPSSIPGQGTRSHMPLKNKIKSCMLQLSLGTAKKKRSRKFQNAKLYCNYLHSIYIVFTTIYMTFKYIRYHK